MRKVAGGWERQLDLVSNKPVAESISVGGFFGSKVWQI